MFRTVENAVYEMRANLRGVPMAAEGDGGLGARVEVEIGLLTNWAGCCR